MRRRALLITCMLTLVGCAASSRAPSSRPNIYVMRHLNTPKGATNPDLTLEGRAAAEALAKWLAADPPRAVFVSDTKRARQTAAPVAARFGLTPTVYDASDTTRLVASVLALQGTVLVVGHSNTVPDIIAALGSERPAALSHEDFGDIWRIQGAARTTTRFKFPKG